MGPGGEGVLASAPGCGLNRRGHQVTICHGTVSGTVCAVMMYSIEWAFNDMGAYLPPYLL